MTHTVVKEKRFNPKVAACTKVSIHGRIMLHVADFIKETGRKPSKVLLGHIEYKQLKEYVYRMQITYVDPDIKDDKPMEFMGYPVEEAEMDSCIGVTRSEQQEKIAKTLKRLGVIN